MNLNYWRLNLRKPQEAVKVIGGKLDITNQEEREVPSVAYLRNSNSAQPQIAQDKEIWNVQGNLMNLLIKEWWRSLSQFPRLSFWSLILALLTAAWFLFSFFFFFFLHPEAEALGLTGRNDSSAKARMIFAYLVYAGKYPGKCPRIATKFLKWGGNTQPNCQMVTSQSQQFQFWLGEKSCCWCGSF